MTRIPVVVIAGGDVSGKSNLLLALRQRYPQAHFLDEVATDVYSDPHNPHPDPGNNEPVRKQAWIKSFQILLACGQVTQEALAQRIARERRCPLIISDRGLLDHWAYLHPEDVADFEQITGLTREAAASRYHQVLYLESLVASDPTLYLALQASNPGRQLRDIDEMLKLEARISEAWRPHPRLHRIDGRRAESLHVERAVAIVEEILRGVNPSSSACS